MTLTRRKVGLVAVALAVAASGAAVALADDKPSTPSGDEPLANATSAAELTASIDAHAEDVEVVQAEQPEAKDGSSPSRHDTLVTQVPSPARASSPDAEQEEEEDEVEEQGEVEDVEAEDPADDHGEDLDEQGQDIDDQGEQDDGGEIDD